MSLEKEKENDFFFYCRNCNRHFTRSFPYGTRVYNHSILDNAPDARYVVKNKEPEDVVCNLCGVANAVKTKPPNEAKEE